MIDGGSGGIGYCCCGVVIVVGLFGVKVGVVFWPSLRLFDRRFADKSLL